MPATLQHPRQMPLAIRDARLPQRMMEISAAREALESDEETVIEMVEVTGWIGWAWNIATAGAKRREFRILARCVADVKPFAADYHGQERPAEVPDYTLAQVVTFLFGRERPVIYGTEFHKAFNCDSGLMINLALDGSIKRLPKTSWRRGPGGSPAFAWDEIVRFVAQRRIQ